VLGAWVTPYIVVWSIHILRCINEGFTS
jgi:hypothetical protein